MFDKLKRLLQHKIKISVTIVTPPPLGVEYTHAPRVIEQSGPEIMMKKHSNFRFVEESKTDELGKERTWYYTEAFMKGHWYCIGDFKLKKDEGMKHHLELVERGLTEPVAVKSVLWEGLSKDETKLWVGLKGDH